MKKNTEYLRIGLASIVSDGKDPIRVLSFLSHYVTQSGELKLTYPSGLSGVSFRAAPLSRQIGVAPAHGGMFIAFRGKWFSTCIRDGRKYLGAVTTLAIFVKARVRPEQATSYAPKPPKRDAEIIYRLLS